MSDEPRLYYVCEVDENGKVIGRASDSQVPYNIARAAAKDLTKMYAPVGVDHYEWLMKQRELRK